MSKYLLLLSFLLLIVFSCSDKKETKIIDEQKIIADTLDSKMLTDTLGLGVFWKEFKVMTQNENYTKLADISYFPFLNHGSYISKEEFSGIRFPDYILEDIAKSGSPVKSKMIFEEGVDSKGDVVESPFNGNEEWPVYEVDLNGASLYFSRVEEQFVFIGLLYGE